MRRRRATDAGQTSPPIGDAHRLGAWGEDCAAAHLARLGLHCCARNLRLRGCEIDLLVRRRRLWVAVEVKTRRHHPAPERLLDDGRIARLTRALIALAPALQPPPRRLRVDVVAVQPAAAGAPHVLHFPGRELPWPESRL